MNIIRNQGLDNNRDNTLRELIGVWLFVIIIFAICGLIAYQTSNIQ